MKNEKMKNLFTLPMFKIRKTYNITSFLKKKIEK